MGGGLVVVYLGGQQRCAANGGARGKRCVLRFDQPLTRGAAHRKAATGREAATAVLAKAEACRRANMMAVVASTAHTHTHTRNDDLFCGEVRHEDVVTQDNNGHTTTHTNGEPPTLQHPLFHAHTTLQKQCNSLEYLSSFLCRTNAPLLKAEGYRQCCDNPTTSTNAVFSLSSPKTDLSSAKLSNYSNLAQRSCCDTTATARTLQQHQPLRVPQNTHTKPTQVLFDCCFSSS